MKEGEDDAQNQVSLVWRKLRHRFWIDLTTEVLKFRQDHKSKKY